MTHPFGIDFGGTGIKGAPVDIDRGDFAAPRERIPTPEESTPDKIAAVFADLVGRFASTGPIGVTVPGVVRGGVVRTAANIDPAWTGVDADDLFSRALGRPVRAINDADAAGLAEARYGAARGVGGLVLVTTLGTGIGSALIHNGVLVPNAELGRLELDGNVAETRAGNRARQREDLTMEQWAERLTRYYAHLDRIFSPDLIVVGGGISKRADEFLSLIRIDAPLVPAVLRNRAGVVGAALHATATA